MGIVFVFVGVSLIGFSNIDEEKSISNFYLFFLNEK